MIPHTQWIKCVVACEREYSRQTLPPASSWRCLWRSSSSAAPALWEAQRQKKKSRQSTITHWDSLWSLSIMTAWVKLKESLIVLATTKTKTLDPSPTHTTKRLKMKRGKMRCWLSVRLKWGNEEVHWLLFLCLCIWYDDQSVDGHVDQQGSHGGVEDSAGQQLICQVDWEQVRLTGTRQPAQRHQPRCTHTLENYAARWGP